MGSGVRALGYRGWALGHERLSRDCSMLDVRCWMFDVGCSMLDVRCSLFRPASTLQRLNAPTISHLPTSFPSWEGQGWVPHSRFDVGCWMLDVGCWMLDVGCW